jgi:P27 family predicted phage terminase small subunit
MTAAEYRKKIVKDCKAIGTYKPQFDGAIDTLCGILEKRDNAQELFEKSGGKVIVKHTNKGGATNLEQNPALRLINDLNRDALAYWRELGLTPAALKRIDETAVKTKDKSPSPLEKALMKLG